MARDGLRRSLLEEDVLRYLTPKTRAEYLLQRHCRRTLRRNYDYLVRCKPMSDTASLNQTEIEVQDEAPPLRHH